MSQACRALGLSRATTYRRQRPAAPRAPQPKTSFRRIPDDERAGVLAVLDSERFVDQTPREVYGALLSEGTYHCSVRTMYRILNEVGPVRERREQRERRSHAIPRVTATAPHQVWTWDVSKLATVQVGVFLNLYLVLDLFSRYVVAWMVDARENGALAKHLFAEALAHHGVAPGTITVHQDRGAPMTSGDFVNLLKGLGVDRSYSRPRVSNDNPFSEAQFRTLKYQPDYPGRFTDEAHARSWLAEYVAWYNDQHHHEGLALFTPADVFFGRVDAVAATRQLALDEAFERHPERFVNGPPRVPRPPTRVCINPIDAGAPSTTVEQLLRARDEEVGALVTPPPRLSTAPLVVVPGPLSHGSGAAMPPVPAT